jgi:hypothetical protein
MTLALRDHAVHREVENGEHGQESGDAAQWLRNKKCLI